MSTKPEAAAFKESFSDLSIKQLKNMLKAKAATFGKAKKDTVLKKLDQMAEKDQLLKLVQEHVHHAEIEALLQGGAGPVMPSQSQVRKVNMGFV